jgi:hypothetical protein
MWAVIEDVPQVRVATAAEGFGAGHTVARVAVEFDIFGGDGLIVAGPAGTGVKLRLGCEERLSAADAHVGSFFFGVFVFAGEGWFSTFLARDVILVLIQLRFPFRFGLFYFFGHGHRLHLTQISWLVRARWRCLARIWFAGARRTGRLYWRCGALG